MSPEPFNSKKFFPLISIIIPYYRRPHLLRQTVKSILAQKDINLNQIEILICEYEPSPAAKKLTQLAPQIHHYRGLYQEGPGGNRQTGIHYARGKYMVFLDADDLPAPTFISQMIIALEFDPKASGAVCFSRSFFTPGFKFRERIKLLPLMLIRDLSLIVSLIFNRGHLFPGAFYLCQLSHMMFRREMVKKLKFNYDYRRGGEDWDFIIQAQKLGPIRVVPHRLLFFRYALGSSTFTDLNLKLKWQSYSLLASRLSHKFRRGLFYRMFLFYIKIFRG